MRADFLEALDPAIERVVGLLVIARAKRHAQPRELNRMFLDFRAGCVDSSRAVVA